MTKLKLTCALMVAGLAVPAAAEETALVTFKALKPAIALQMAQAAMQYCSNEGYQVGVAVVDRSGTLQVFLRDQYAGVHTIETATRKAWTAVSFKTDTMSLADATAPGTASSAIRNISRALPLGGGVPVQIGGSLVAGIGVSGAPGPELDDACARIGIDSIQDILDFGM